MISSVTTIVVLIFSSIGKFFYSRYALNYKLNREYEYEQRKKIQSELGKYKGKLLNAAEELNHRLWNFSKKRKDGWHKVLENEYTSPSKYYFQSFIYRFLVFFYWANKIEKETEYIDTTIASKSESIFLMYLKNLKLVFCDVLLFEGTDYDTKKSKDHFFKHKFEQSLRFIEKDDDVLDFDEFTEKFRDNIKDYKKWAEFISGISVNSPECLRWNIIISFHLMLMSFLNEYGYDFQKTNKKKLVLLLDTYGEFKLKDNFIKLVKRNQMDKSKAMKYMLKLL